MGSEMCIRDSQQCEGRCVAGAECDKQAVNRVRTHGQLWAASEHAPELVHDVRQVRRADRLQHLEGDCSACIARRLELAAEGTAQLAKHLEQLDGAAVRREMQRQTRGSDNEGQTGWQTVFIGMQGLVERRKDTCRDRGGKVQGYGGRRPVGLCQCRILIHMVHVLGAVKVERFEHTDNATHVQSFRSGRVVLRHMFLELA